MGVRDEGREGGRRTRGEGRRKEIMMGKGGKQEERERKAY